MPHLVGVAIEPTDEVRSALAAANLAVEDDSQPDRVNVRVELDDPDAALSAVRQALARFGDPDVEVLLRD